MASQQGGVLPKRWQGSKRHVEGGAARAVARPTEGVHFRVGTAEALVRAFPDAPVSPGHHRAHDRVGVGARASALGQSQGAGHPTDVVGPGRVGAPA
jgi:hypothetical protein